jgi:DNA-binding GntR family transcriptional regulator
MPDAMRPVTPLAPSVLSAQVKDRILQWILEGELAPGSRIIETRVARQLGTSQAPVREALRDLATLGLIEMHPYRGARVREPAAEELIEAMEVRGELEAIAARQAAELIDDATLERMRGLMQEMREAAARGDAHTQALRNSEFHTCVIDASGNRTVQRLWSMLEPFARTYLTATAPGADLRWLADRHSAILDALVAHDADAAAEQMRIHARQAEQLIQKAS